MSLRRFFIASLGGSSSPSGPTVTSIIAGAPNTVTVVFSENMNVTSTGWTFMINGAPATITNCIGAGLTWDFEITEFAIGNTLSFSYNPAVGNTENFSAVELNTYANSPVDNASLFEAETTTFMAAISVANNATTYFTATAYEQTGAQLWKIINNHIKNIKGTGNRNQSIDFASKIFVRRICLGIDATVASKNLLDPSIKPMVWGGTWIFDGRGAVPNGSAYGDTNVSPSELDIDNFAMERYNGSTSPGATTMMSLWDGSEGFLIHHGSSDTTFITAQGLNSSIETSDAFTAGSRMLNRLSGDTIAYNNGRRTTVLVAQTPPALTANIDHNCLKNESGSRALFSSAILAGDTIFNVGLTADEVNVWNIMVEDLNRNLGRDFVKQRMLAKGDSTTYAVNVSFNEAWAALVVLSKDFTLINNGLQGASLENAFQLNFINGPNMYDDVDSIFQYDPRLDACITISFSINDCGFNWPAPTGYYPVKFASQALSIFQKLKNVCAYPVDRIVPVIGLYTENFTWADYAAITGTPLVDNTRHRDMIDLATIEASNEGILEIDPWYDMLAAGGTGPDGRHPTAPQHIVIANKVLADILI